MFVEDPIDTWVQHEHTRGADRHTPFVHPNFVEDTGLLTQSTRAHTRSGWYVEPGLEQACRDIALGKLGS
jgi:hypothetical protein